MRQFDSLMQCCVSVTKSCPTLCDPMTVARQAPLSMGFSRQEYWSGLLCPPPGNLLDSGIEPVSPTSSALADKFFITSATWEAHQDPCAVLCLVAQSCPTLYDPMTVARQAPLSVRFFRQGYWSGLPCPPPGDLLTQGSNPHL